MKFEYSKPAIEIVELEMETEVMTYSTDMATVDEDFSGTANSKQRGFWEN